MDPIIVFQNYLRKFAELSDDEFNDLLVPIIKVRSFGKREVITKLGEVEDYCNFIVLGLARKYYTKGKQEMNIQISFENHFILSQESFHSRTASDYTIESIEPVTLVSLKYKDLEDAFQKSHRLEHLGRAIVTFATIVKDHWQMQMVKMNARERFLNFVTKNPVLMQRVPQKMLASYLNIKPETFSRFKHLIKDHLKEKKELMETIK